MIRPNASVIHTNVDILDAYAVFIEIQRHMVLLKESGYDFVIPLDVDEILYYHATGGLKGFLQLPYTILKHQAAIRPTVADRRPFVGFLHNKAHIGIFNGLGTKGVSLAPFFAQQLVQHMVEQKSLMKEVDINRFLASSPPNN